MKALTLTPEKQSSRIASRLSILGNAEMTISKEIREIEKHLNGMTTDKAEQIAIISKAQAMCGDERSLSILCIIKRRIINL